MARRKTKKRTAKRRGNFVSKLQRRPKIRSIRKKIKENKSKAKKLSAEYRRALKSEAKKIR